MSRILIFEKNGFFRDALLRMIEGRFPDTSIKCVSSSEECLCKTGVFKPDVFILGVNIYSGSDLNQLDQLRAEFPGVNIILFTDYGMEEYRKEAIMRGANHIISKDLWTGNEILALLKTILASHGPFVEIRREGSAADAEVLQQPLERRRRDPRGRLVEQKYLAHHHDRRN